MFFSSSNVPASNDEETRVKSLNFISFDTFAGTSQTPFEGEGVSLSIHDRRGERERKGWMFG